MRFTPLDAAARAAAVLLLAGFAPGLAGCVPTDRAVASSPVPEDFHQRHPVALTNARTVLDVFLVGSSLKLDERQRRDVEAFADDYRRNGHGLIRALLPRGGVDPRTAEATLTAVRHALSGAAIGGDMEVGSYQALDPHLAAPVRLSFVKLQAQVASHCGDWPTDLASGSSIDRWENREWYNMGCASQKTLTAQVEDPRDLVRPRAEDPSDVKMRTRAIGDIRGTDGAGQGTDPSTAWGQTRPIFQ